MNLIIVENDNDQVTSYLDAITLLNAEGEGVIISPVIVNTLQEALGAIERESFDAAVVDLRLSGNQSEAEGNEVIRKIVNLKRFPVFVYSSFIGDIDPEIEESIFFRKFERTSDTFQDIVFKLREIYKTGVTNVLGRGGVIEGHLTKIFWQHIAESFEDLCQKGVTEEQLLRYITGHLHEYLELGEVDGDFKKYLPEEVYIKPSIKPHFFTGSIIKEKTTDKKYIILTPACDIANGKAKYILFASISDLTEDPVRSIKTKANDEIPGDLNEAQREKRENDKEDAKDNLEKIIRNRYSDRYYFLPQSRNFNGGLINFQDLESAKSGGMSDRFDIIAAISSQFLKDIVARFSFYYSRQGAPEIDCSVNDLP